MGILAWIKTAGERKFRERRKYPRISDSLEINYEIPNEPLHIGCRSKDISEGGIRFCLYQNLQPGSAIKLGLYLPESGGPIWLFGKVAWIKQTTGDQYLHEAGVEFVGLDSSLRSKIQNHIQDAKNRGQGPKIR